MLLFLVCAAYATEEGGSGVKKQSFYNLYSETHWDPLLYEGEKVGRERASLVGSLSGFLDSHDPPDRSPSLESFGDISLFNINLYREILKEKEIYTDAKAVRKILDEAHPTFLAMQGVSEQLLREIERKIKNHPHYAIVNNDRSSKDLRKGFNLYLPIIYDTTLVKVRKNDYFEKKGDSQVIYASYAMIEDVRYKKDATAYTIINMDLLSAFKDNVSAEFMNIALDINGSKEVSSHPVFILGGMGALPPDVKKLMSGSYSNLIKLDKNNEGRSEATMHDANLVPTDDVQKDFIIMKDQGGIFVLNYARILKRYVLGSRYPIHAILSFKTNVEGKAPERNVRIKGKRKKKTPVGEEVNRTAEPGIAVTNLKL
jgi:hypothetical protein